MGGKNPPPPDDDASAFAVGLEAAVLPLQLALRSLYTELGRPKNTVAMQRQLGVGNTICWQVYRIINADSLFGAARHAPLPQAIAQFLDAAERVGASPAVLGDVRGAADGFRTFMKKHADDQASFDTLIAGVGGDDGEEVIQVRHRRAAYRAESHIWGFQRDVSAMVAFVRPSDAKGTLDVAMVLCQVGYRRLRVNASATVAAFGAADVWGSKLRALDADAMEKYHCPLVPEFCSSPVPALERVPLANGPVVYRLDDTSLGRGGSKDLTLGFVSYREEPDTVDGRPSLVLNNFFFCPTARVVLDVFLDRTVLGHRMPSVTTRLGNYGDDDPRGHPLPLGERVLPLGSADRELTCPDIPNYPQLIRHTAQKTGWPLGQFDHFRVTLDYPIFASRMKLSVPVD